MKDDEKVEPIEKVPKEQIKEHNAELKKIFFVGGFIVILFLMIFFMINSLNQVKYENLLFEKIKEGTLTFYKTSFPLVSPITGKHVADYNVFIRNNPDKLKKIPFDGELSLKKNVVLNFTGEFNCDGDGIIATGNLVQVFTYLEIETIKDPNAKCDEYGRYTFVQIQEGNETKIEQYGPSCYNIYVKDCEILPAVEKFMIESLVQIKETI